MIYYWIQETTTARAQEAVASLPSSLLTGGVVVGILGLIFAQLRHTQVLRQARELEAQRAHEAALQKYFEQMREALADPNRPLGRSTMGDTLSTVARAQTLAVLEGLDPVRKRILLQFLKESNLIRADNPIISLLGADLGRAYLERAYMIGVNLEGANLTEANLGEANLQRANLAGANLENAHPGGANLREGYRLQTVADLREANLQEADMQRANLGGVNLEGANLEGANLTEANLQRANLREANLQATLQRTNLEGAALGGANLEQAFMIGAKLEGANLTEANLQQSNLTGANLQRAYLTKANLREASLVGANLKGASLRGADLRGADLRRSLRPYLLVQDFVLGGAYVRVRKRRLTQEQIDLANGDKYTKLPDHLKRPAHWS